MRQVPGQSLVLPVKTANGGVPNLVGDGADLTLIQAAAKVWKYAIKVTLVGGTSTNLKVWVQESTDDAIDSGSFDWMLLGDTGNLGLLGGQALPSSATYVFVVENLGIFKKVCLGQSGDVGGAVTVTATITEFIENNFMCGD